MPEFSEADAAILDRYTFEMMKGPDGRLNRELGAQILYELVGNEEEGHEPNVGQLNVLGATDSMNLSMDRALLGSNTINVSGEFEAELDPDARREALLALVIASLVEIEHPTAPVSKDLYDNPAAELDAPRQLEHYLNYLRQEQPTVMTTVEEEQAQLGPPRNDINSQRCIVAIPVAGHQEYQNIYTSLEQFAKQSLSQDEFEVVLGLNLPAPEVAKRFVDREGQLASELELTLSEIARFQQDYPDFPLRYYTHAYRGDPPKIGRIRADLWAAIGLDAQKRGLEKDLLIISGDADIVSLNRNYLQSMVQTAEQTGADIVTAGLRWQMAPGLPYDAMVNKMLRYQTFLDDVRDRHAKLLHTSDANTGISLAMYFAIGGFNRDVALGEMMDLAHDIRGYRNTSQTEYRPAKLVEAKASDAWLKTHSRRLIRVMALGHRPYDAWDQKLIVFGTDDELRTEAMQVHAANEQAAKNWKKWVKSETPYYMRNVPLAKKRRILKAARHVLGFSDLYRN